MPFCWNCGKEIGVEDIFCPHCGSRIDKREEKALELPAQQIRRTDAVSAIQKGLDIVSAKPIVLAPALLGAVVSAVLSFIASFWFMPLEWWSWYYWPGALGLMVIGGLLGLIGGIVAFVMGFASLDMSRNAYLNKDLDVSSSVNYVIKRFLTFILASIVGAILSITVILFPVAILMFVIIVVDEIGISPALSGAIRVLGNRLADIIVLLIIAIIGNLIVGLIPVVGPLLSAAFNVLMGLAFIDIYFNYKSTGS